MISILIPAYNAAPYIETAIASVFDQDPGMPLEVLVMDDGSTDRTAKILERLAAEEPRLRVLRQENQGVSAARNALIAALGPATELVAFLDADDAFPMGRLSRDVALLAADPELEVVYGKQRMVDNGALDLRSAVRPDDVRVRGISVNVVTLRRRIIDNNGPFDTSMTHGEDFDYILRLFEHSPKRVLLDEVSLLYRQNGIGAMADRTNLRRGVMRAMMLHGRRLREDPTLARAEGIFAVDSAANASPLPRYSVVIPAYNAARFLRETITSVLAQTHPPDEVVIVDDGSTDDTRAVLTQLEGPITIIAQSNAGAAAATNAGIIASHNGHIAFLDADDLWHPKKMEKQLWRLTHGDRLAGVFCRAESFANDGAALQVDDSQSGWGRSTMVVKRAAFDRAGLIPDYGKRAGEMIDWIARARDAGLDFFMMEEALVRRRLHAASMTARAGEVERDYFEAIKASIRRKRAARETPP